MNTILLIRNVSSEKYGGAESYQIELARLLKKNKYEPIIFSNSKKLLENSRYNQIKTVIPPYQKRQNWSNWRNILMPIYIFWQMRVFFWYKKQFKHIKPTAVFIQSRDEWIAATLAAKNQRIKCFWIDHIDFRTWVLQNADKPFKNIIGKIILKLAHNAQKIIMISDFEAKNFEKYKKSYRLQNVEIIKNGVMDERTKFKKDAKKKRAFCYVGRLVDYKGINEMISAFKKIENKEILLNIYGDGEDKNKYITEAAGDDRIKFHGYTNEPLRAICESDCFILPSYYEGLSISLLQAAMLGKTIVSTDIDGNPEVVEHKKTGLLVRPKNIEDLTSAMKWVLRNPKKAEQLGMNAREKYEQEFNLEKNVKEKIIGELLK